MFPACACGHQDDAFQKKPLLNVFNKTRSIKPKAVSFVLREVVIYMQHQANRWPSIWFPVPRKRDNPVMRLFCFPYAGGSSSDAIFREWAIAMPDHVEVAVLEMPGRARRMAEPSETSLFRLVERLLPVFASCADRPFAFFGHSLGAIVAYELARALSAAKMPCPSLLMVSAKQAPHMPYTRRLFDLPRDQFIIALRELNGTPDEVLQNEELLDIVVSVLRNDLEMAFKYRFEGAPLRGIPIHAFGGENDPHVETESILAWDHHTDLPFRSEIHPGGHFYIQQDSRDAIRERIVELMTALCRDADRSPESAKSALPLDAHPGRDRAPTCEVVN
jgi:medium-chain acyl-[acyl-carrier-protein] hydrolase